MKKTQDIFPGRIIRGQFYEVDRLDGNLTRGDGGAGDDWPGGLVLRQKTTIQPEF